MYNKQKGTRDDEETIEIVRIVTSDEVKITKVSVSIFVALGDP